MTNEFEESRPRQSQSATARPPLHNRPESTPARAPPTTQASSGTTPSRHSLPMAPARLPTHVPGPLNSTLPSGMSRGGAEFQGIHLKWLPLCQDRVPRQETHAEGLSGPGKHCPTLDGFIAPPGRWQPPTDRCRDRCSWLGLRCRLSIQTSCLPGACRCDWGSLPTSTTRPRNCGGPSRRCAFVVSTG